MTKNRPLFPLTCVLFAGGRSSRMGQDKSLLPFGQYDSLAEYQYQRLLPLFTNVYIVSKHNKFTFDADIILDLPTTDVYAPTIGFVSAFKQLHDERLFVLSVDTPFVGNTEISTLINNDSPVHDAVIAQTHSGTHPMCGIYHRSLLPAFEAMVEANNHRLGQLLKVSKSKFVMFEEEESFMNLNHPEEYEAALKRV